MERTKATPIQLLVLQAFFGKEILSDSKKKKKKKVIFGVLRTKGGFEIFLSDSKKKKKKKKVQV